MEPIIFDRDDLPGYLLDAYQDAIDRGLQQLNLTRVGGGAHKGWQCSSRWPGAANTYSVHIDADPFTAIMDALSAHRRPSPEPEPEPAGGLFD